MTATSTGNTGKVASMLGALMLRNGVRRNQAKLVSSKDIEALKQAWADDVTLTFAGQAPIRGNDAVERLVSVLVR